MESLLFGVLCSVLVNLWMMVGGGWWLENDGWKMVGGG